MLVCAQPFFLEAAIKLDPFGSPHFLWVDIGCFRDAAAMPQYRQGWPSPAVLSKHARLVLLRIAPFTQVICTSSGASCGFIMRDL